MQTGFHTHTGAHTLATTATRPHPRSAIAVVRHLHETAISGLDGREVAVQSARDLGRAAQTPPTVPHRGHIPHDHRAQTATALLDDPRLTRTFRRRQPVAARLLPTPTTDLFHIDHVNGLYHLQEALGVLQALGDPHIGEQAQQRVKGSIEATPATREAAVVHLGALELPHHAAGGLLCRQGGLHHQQFETQDLRHAGADPLASQTAVPGHLFGRAEIRVREHLV